MRGLGDVKLQLAGVGKLNGWVLELNFAGQIILNFSSELFILLLNLFISLFVHLHLFIYLFIHSLIYSLTTKICME